jgi:deoxyhypusine synthase
MAASKHDTSHFAPDTATGAVLMPSQPMPAGTQQVSGINFDNHPNGISAEELLAGMANMGFQASGVADAVRIINDMVRNARSSVRD